MRVHFHRADARRARWTGGLRRLALLLLAGFVVGGLAACGGSGEEDLTRADYIADADAICAAHGANALSLEDQFNQALQSSELEDAAQFFENQATEVSAMLDELEGLTPPVADQTSVNEIIALGRERVQLAREAADAIASGDKEAMIAAGKQGSVLAGQYYQMADGFGFQSCGSAGGPGTGGATGATGATGTAS